PIGFGGGINTYAYAGNRPLAYTDALGLNPVAGCAAGIWGGPVGCGVGAILGGLLGGAALAAILSVPGDTVQTAPSVTDQAGRRVSPLAETLEPPGNCSPGEQRQLQEEVNRACKQQRTCKMNTDPAQAIIFRERNR